jgi:hypothetical protein
VVPRKEPNYLTLMILALAAVALITSASPLSAWSLLGVFVSAGVLMVTAYRVSARRRQTLVAALYGLLALLPLAAFVLRRRLLFPRLASQIYAANLVCWLLFTFYVAVMVFRGIMRSRHVRINEIYGAIYVYLLIGVLFAQVFQLLLVAKPDALYFDPRRFPAPLRLGDALVTRGAGDILYYSFITLGTVGYGDVTPASPLARSLSLLEAVIGIMYVATMIARFVSIQLSLEHRHSPEP